MGYELKDIINFLKVFNKIESEAKDFLFLASFAMKYKDKISKSAKTTLNAIYEYKKLPIEIRNELELDKNTSVSKITELEKICKKYLVSNS